MSPIPFEQIVSEHGAAILRVCRAVAGPLDAEDVWSETFLAALRAYDRLAPESHVEAWLVTIAHRKAIDHRRAAARRPIAVDPLPEPRAPARGLSGRATGLWRAVERLPLRQRRALAYHHLAGLPYRDVARIIGGSEAAARRAAADGLAALRRVLRPPTHGSRRSPVPISTLAASPRAPRKGALR